MTSSSSRLDRIENDLETVKEIMLTLARRAEATDARIDRLAERQDRTQTQLDQLGVDVDIAFQTITALSDNTDRTLASINASIQRQDRILDYLMRRDGNGTGDP